MNNKRVIFGVTFIINFCIMSFELIIGRVIAPYVGVSLYTWTGVIGIVLFGISIGNYFGGKLADKNSSKNVLGGIIIIAGLFSKLSILFVSILGPSISSLPNFYLIQVILITLIFLFPFIFLGLISPILIKLVLNNLKYSGSTVGTIYSISALGSIAGTYTTGFLLIAHLGTETTVSLIALALFFTSFPFLEFSKIKKRLWLSSISLIIGLGLIYPIKSPCTTESDYYCIRIAYDGLKNTVSLILDRLNHSQSNLSNPNQLYYEYIKIFAVLYDYVHTQQTQALFIGGGGYTLPRYISHAYKSYKNTVVEIDPKISEIAFTTFNADPKTLTNYNLDARIYLKNLSIQKKFDIIFGDAFGSVSVPYHLTTYEFGLLIHEHLNPDGLYVNNLIDIGEFGEFVSSYEYTLSKIFKNTYILKIKRPPEKERLRQYCRDTYVVIATDKRINEQKLKQMAHKLGYENFYIYTNTQIKDKRSTKTQLLTDDFAPVDNMMADAAAGCRFDWNLIKSGYDR